MYWPISAQAQPSGQTGRTNFPNGDTTGVPPGVTLTPHNGNLFSNAVGQVIEGLDVTDTIVINHTNVTVRKCRAGHIGCEAADAAVEDCDVTGGSAPGGSGISAGSTGNNATIRRCNIRGVENGIFIGNATSGHLIEDNYIHDLANPSNPDPHFDGIQFFEGESNTTIRHNNIDLPRSRINSCITMKSAINLNIIDNRLNGGSYSIYIEGRSTGVNVVNNVFGFRVFGFVSGASFRAAKYSGNTDLNGNPIRLP